jgi:hypothetical protein
MVAGIGSVGTAAVSLREVASDQGEVVERLVTQMRETLERVEEMSGLAAQLERRQSDRIAAAGQVVIRIPGRDAPVPAKLVNISSGGVRCAVDPGVALAEGDVVDIQVISPTDSISASARAVNAIRRDGDQEVGLQFLITDEALAGRIADFVRDLLEGLA